ncbi:MAG: FAD-binding protein [Deltaproteobacteria bacterium]|nr:FAD-binding protein [Deltaproteobacteria bacterium]
MIDIDKDPVQADVLVAGGGIAGLMAGIHAADTGASVIVAEKANTKRSGCGATGNDHFQCYIPEVHGDDMRPILKEYLASQVGGFSDLDLAVTFLENSSARVRDWDSWGISMRPQGHWDFSGHAFPGRPRIWLKYAGHNQKEVLTKEAKKRGVQIHNHLSIAELLTKKGEVIGVIGISTRDEQPVLKIFQAKSVILTTGLVNMEFPNRHAGPKYFARCGKATWIGLYKDPHGRTVGPFVTKATRELGDITGDVWSAVFTDKFRSGEGPVYIDCSTTSGEDYEYMMWGLVEEGNTGMLSYMAEEGIDVRKRMVEFMQYEPFLVGRGIEIDEKAETCIKGLYAAGDPVGNFRADCAGAATFGGIAGGSAAKRARKQKSFKKLGGLEMIENQAALYSDILSRKSGPSWKEANLALQQIMNDYAGVHVRSESLLKAGLKYLRDLEKKVFDTMTADDAHTLMRGLETIDLIECGKVIFLAALERKETRGLHRRPDFPFTNPLLQDKFLTIRQRQGKVQTEWRDKR